MERLFDLFGAYFGCPVRNASPITGSASNRKYFRLAGPGVSCIGVVGTDRKENDTFISFARALRGAGLSVPEVYAVSGDGMAYIQEDVGSVSLFEMSDSRPLLYKTISQLPKLQFLGGAAVDFSLSHPVRKFSLQTVMFDLNYFKYCFLKPSGVVFDEVKLQEEFERFASRLQVGREWGTFLYRDFQARNVLIRDGEPCFIDFQGGYEGPIYYDVASFIWHPRASYPEDLKMKMLDVYLEALSDYVSIPREEFMERLRDFILLRYLQILGAYGFRGLVEHKTGFVTVIPEAVEALGTYLKDMPDGYPYMRQLLSEIVAMPGFARREDKDGVLEVDVYSFSFKKGLPVDYSGNGGGYVFDCRGLNNPGRYERYRDLTGEDEAVKVFLEEDGEILTFLEHARSVVDPHVESFLRRGFTRLMVSFGCTGGQHRSVYCAGAMASHLAEKYPQIRVRLVHRERGVERWM